MFFHNRNKSAPISSICTELLDRWILLICPSCGRYSAFCVMNIGGMDHDRQQTARHIRYDMPLSAFRFFPPSIPACSTCSCASLCIGGRFLPTAHLPSRWDMISVLFFHAFILSLSFPVVNTGSNTICVIDGQHRIFAHSGSGTPSKQELRIAFLTW